jgi:hypothetical protein
VVDASWFVAQSFASCGKLSFGGWWWVRRSTAFAGLSHPSRPILKPLVRCVIIGRSCNAPDRAADKIDTQDTNTAATDVDL